MVVPPMTAAQREVLEATLRKKLRLEIERGELTPTIWEILLNDMYERQYRKSLRIASREAAAITGQTIKTSVNTQRSNVANPTRKGATKTNLATFSVAKADTEVVNGAATNQQLRKERGVRGVDANRSRQATAADHVKINVNTNQAPQKKGTRSSPVVFPSSPAPVNRTDKREQNQIAEHSMMQPTTQAPMTKAVTTDTRPVLLNTVFLLQC